jgi:two-component system sensor kinase FixL
VIRHVRALVKKGNQDFTDLDVGETILEVVAFLHGDIVGRNGCVGLELTPDLPIVHGDPIQLQQVMINLILNAFDAMDELPFPQRRVTISATPESSDSVRVSVRDRGKGIPSDKLDLIFQPFFSTKPRGMGMGLSVTRSIVDSHGGRVWAENHDGGGAVFHVTLPVRNGE